MQIKKTTTNKKKNTEEEGKKRINFVQIQPKKQTKNQ